jgi:hypothetical protein
LFTNVGGGPTYWLRYELGEDISLVVFGNGSYDGGEGRDIAEFMLLRYLAPETVEVDVLLRCAGVIVALCFVVLDQGAGDVGAGPHEAFTFWGKIEGLGWPALHTGRQCDGLS